MDETTANILEYILSEIEKLSNMVGVLNKQHMNMGGGPDNIKITKNLSDMELRLTDVKRMLDQ